MEQRSYSATAPGSLMLLGEHAVIVGKHALVCAINRRIKVKLTPRDDKSIIIQDKVLGRMEQTIDDIRLEAPYTFVLQAITFFRKKLRTGFALDISADFASDIGFGSSAAVTVATVAVLNNWLSGRRCSLRRVFMQSKRVMLAVQKVGSGADIAASVYGGVLYYKNWIFGPKRLGATFPLITAVYSGYKTPTPQVIKRVLAAQSERPEHFNLLYKAIDDCVKQAAWAIRARDWQQLGQAMMRNHSLQNSLGVSDLVLNELVSTLCAQTEIYGAKISGAGLGDCVIGVGTLQRDVFPINQEQAALGVCQFSLQVMPRGLCYE